MKKRFVGWLIQKKLDEACGMFQLTLLYFKAKFVNEIDVEKYVITVLHKSEKTKP